MSDYLELLINVFDELNQKVKVRGKITAGELKARILREYKRADESPDEYVLCWKISRKSLVEDISLVEQGVVPNDHFVLDQAFQTKSSSQISRVILHERRSGRVFPISFQPALIGRSTSQQANSTLTVNVEELPNSRLVSRLHAQITEQEGHYYIERLSPNNLTSVNEEVLPFSKMRLLKSGDRINLGKSGISLTFLIEESKSVI